MAMSDPQLVIVPGAGVRRYVEPIADAMASLGLKTRLLSAPGQPGSPADLRQYGTRLGVHLCEEDPVDLLVGLSVGTQAAAVAAAVAGPARVRHLVLVGPTVDSERRSAARFLRAWASAGPSEDPTLFWRQLPDWREAGARRLLTVVRSALGLPLELVLPDVECRITVVHAEGDRVTSHGYAASLASRFGGLVVVPGATHSWPYGDGSRFADVVTAVLS
jgi:pimeloyl-ACP methyl ester carboxylesterase